MPGSNGDGRVRHEAARRWVIVGAGCVGIAAVLVATHAFRHPAPVAHTGRGGQTVAASARLHATTAASHPPDCQITSIGYSGGTILATRQCAHANSATLEYPVTSIPTGGAVAALRAACQAYVGTGADHAWVNTYVVPQVRKQLREAGGRCGDWLALGNPTPPRMHATTRTTEAVLYGGG